MQKIDRARGYDAQFIDTRGNITNCFTSLFTVKFTGVLRCSQSTGTTGISHK